MLSKFVAWAISPLGTAMLLVLGAMVLRALRRRRGAGLLAATAAAWLLLWATPPVADTLQGWLEDQAGPRALADVPPAEVAVVLGGAVNAEHPPRNIYPDLGRASDRVWHAARLYHAGKVRRVLLSGGTLIPGEPAEAPAMRRFLLDLGVPDSAIVLEQASATTAANAGRTAQMLQAMKIDTIVLVTSAAHMPRARLNFEHLGLVVHPAPTDFEIVDAAQLWTEWLPSAGALDRSARAFKEVVGRWAVQVARPGP